MTSSFCCSHFYLSQEWPTRTVAWYSMWGHCILFLPFPPRFLFFLCLLIPLAVVFFPLSPLSFYTFFSPLQLFCIMLWHRYCKIILFSLSVFSHVSNNLSVYYRIRGSAILHMHMLCHIMGKQQQPNHTQKPLCEITSMCQYKKEKKQVSK